MQNHGLRSVGPREDQIACLERPAVGLKEQGHKTNQLAEVRGNQVASRSRGNFPGDREHGEAMAKTRSELRRLPLAYDESGMKGAHRDNGIEVRSGLPVVDEFDCRRYRADPRQRFSRSQLRRDRIREQDAQLRFRVEALAVLGGNGIASSVEPMPIEPPQTGVMEAERAQDLGRVDRDLPSAARHVRAERDLESSQLPDHSRAIAFDVL